MKVCLRLCISKWQEQEKKLASDQGSAFFPGHGQVPSDEAKDRLAAAMDKSNEKKKAFSRRMVTNADEDCNFQGRSLPLGVFLPPPLVRPTTTYRNEYLFICIENL